MMTVHNKPTATIVRCPIGPVNWALANARLLVTFKALCAVADIHAMRKPSNSYVGALQDAAAIPTAIGISDNNVGIFGKAFTPSNSNVNRTVMMGIPHFDV